MPFPLRPTELTNSNLYSSGNIISHSESEGSINQRGNKNMRVRKFEFQTPIANLKKMKSRDKKLKVIVDSFTSFPFGSYNLIILIMLVD